MSANLFEVNWKKIFYGFPKTSMPIGSSVHICVHDEDYMLEK